MSWTIVTGIGGVLGLALSIYNTCAARQKDRPQLEIVEDYRAGAPMPKFSIRLENRGRIPIAIESVDLQIKAGGKIGATTFWQREEGASMVIAPGRSEVFPLPPEAAFSARERPDADVVVRTEDGKLFNRHCESLGDFFQELLAIAEHGRVPGSSESPWKA